MKVKLLLISLLFFACFKPEISSAQAYETPIEFDFYGDPIAFQLDTSFLLNFNSELSSEAIEDFYTRLNASGYQSILNVLEAYKVRHQPDDWLYYQLIRKTVQQISPKAENYQRYTLYKWFLMYKSGYDAILTFSGKKILFYVRSNENIYNIPNRVRDGKQYVCLNYHDYNSINFDIEKFSEAFIPANHIQKTFSYKITRLPDFRKEDYVEKDIRFNYNQNEYDFKVKLNPQVKTIFTNYPVVDYESFFNIPLSKETYSSLIPLLKRNIKGLSTKNGVDYLMRFTRYAFSFETDLANFGQEKRLSPEQTLLYEYSDCEDRVALFFCLVKEIYDLPMIVLAFPKHVTIAVKFDRTFGKPILYNGISYSVCEPTPQKKDLNVGQLLPELRKTAYEVAYVYTPKRKR